MQPYNLDEPAVTINGALGSILDEVITGCGTEGSEGPSCRHRLHSTSSVIERVEQEDRDSTSHCRAFPLC